MKVVVFIGPPGAGKGTQAGLLQARLGVLHVSTGALLRDEIALASELGVAVKTVVESGRLVGDGLLFECLKARLARLDVGSDTTMVLDGVPRNLSQVDGLDAVVGEFGLKVGKVVALTADVEKLVERFGKRWSCKKCGAVAAFDSADVARVAKCSVCGALDSFSRRQDDAPEVVRSRMEIYARETSPILSKYAERGLVSCVDALRSVERVYADIGCLV